MAEELPDVLPGDFIQAVDQGPLQGLPLLVQQVQRWGVGAVLRWVDASGDHETYYRLKPAEFVVIGGAHILPADIAEARKDAAATAQALFNERLKNV